MLLRGAQTPDARRRAMLYANNGGGFVIPRAGLVAAFDARLGVTESGGRVSQWADLSGNGRHFAQGNGANQPAYATAGGFPYLDFDGVAYYMETAAFTQAQPITMYLVLNVDTWLGNRTIIDKLAAPNFVALYQTGASPNIAQFCTANGAQSSSLALGTKGVFCSVFNGASSSLKLNIAAATTGNPGTTGLDGLTIGVRNDLGAGTYFDGKVHALLVYGAAHDAATQANINRALMSQWGVA